MGRGAGRWAKPPPGRSQLYFIAIITKYLLATDEIRYLQQSTFTKQENLHTLSFYICPG
ncbi:serine/threonine protein phosphatase [Salmonella enterica]|uniref:serine/threonine protein phosphatase n=1 Tax=Salmonella enterica TaxID=28901 RepID=UPI0027E42836|nr:serine/threonine protein phosphatase [Salmonella enterica]MDQ7464122.1 serine/threonine protein phosphatase [Salmonella enterica subsp. enterica serovar Agona]